MDDMDGSSNSSTTTATASTAQMSLSEDQCHLDSKDRPSIALLSELSRQFVQRVNVLVASRNIFCSTEYPKSFTGEEAVNILILIIGHDWSRKEYRNLARRMMQTEAPALFSPIAYSDKSLRNNTLYDSSQEAYTLNELAENEALAQSLIVPLMDCYTPYCTKGVSSGCYAPTCPNRGSQLLMKSNIINVSAIIYASVYSEQWDSCL